MKSNVLIWVFTILVTLYLPLAFIDVWISYFNKFITYQHMVITLVTKGIGFVVMYVFLYYIYNKKGDV